MISVKAVSSAGNAASYYAKDNYYTIDQAEGASAWAGEGATALGLEGVVDAAPFEAVLEGRLPNGSVIDARRGGHRPGWDLTMSASMPASAHMRPSALMASTHSGRGMGAEGSTRGG